MSEIHQVRFCMSASTVKLTPTYEVMTCQRCHWQ